MLDQGIFLNVRCFEGFKWWGLKANLERWGYPKWATIDERKVFNPLTVDLFTTEN